MGLFMKATPPAFEGTDISICFQLGQTAPHRAKFINWELPRNSIPIQTLRFLPAFSDGPGCRPAGPLRATRDSGENTPENLLEGNGQLRKQPGVVGPGSKKEEKAQKGRPALLDPLPLRQREAGRWKEPGTGVGSHTRLP